MKINSYQEFRMQYYLSIVSSFSVWHINQPFSSLIYLSPSLSLYNDV